MKAISNKQLEYIWDKGYFLGVKAEYTVYPGTPEQYRDKGAKRSKGAPTSIDVNIHPKNGALPKQFDGNIRGVIPYIHINKCLFQSYMLYFYLVSSSYYHISTWKASHCVSKRALLPSAPLNKRQGGACSCLPLPGVPG